MSLNMGHIMCFTYSHIRMCASLCVICALIFVNFAGRDVCDVSNFFAEQSFFNIFVAIY